MQDFKDAGVSDGVLQQAAGLVDLVNLYQPVPKSVSDSAENGEEGAKEVPQELTYERAAERIMSTLDSFFGKNAGRK